MSVFRALCERLSYGSLSVAVATAQSKVLKRFARNLKHEREQARMTQDELAAKAGLSRTVPGLLENGDREAKIGTVVRLAEAMGIPAGRLLDGL